MTSVPSDSHQNMSHDARFGLACRCVRKALGLSAKQVATSSGIPTNVLFDLEEGRCYVYANAARQIAAAMGIKLSAVLSVKELLDDTPDPIYHETLPESLKMAIEALIEKRPRPTTVRGQTY